MLNRAFGARRGPVKNSRQFLYGFFINPADFPSLFLHDLTTLLTRKSREIVEIVGLAEKGKGLFCSVPILLCKE